ncbi:MAG: head-tail connector protein [Sulfitobacter sp.]
MMLIEETTVPDAALPVDAFKAHLRLGSGFGQDNVQDAVLKSFLRAAMAAIEARTGKVLITRSFSWSLTFWRDASAQPLPVAPVVAVSRVALVARDGTPTEVDAAAYWLEQDGQRPKLRSTSSALPGIPSAGAVLIEFDAGYGAAWSDLPVNMAQAVLMLAAHYYEFRNDTGLSDGSLPFGVSSLIERFKTMRIGMGAGR